MASTTQITDRLEAALPGFRYLPVRVRRIDANLLGSSRRITVEPIQIPEQPQVEPGPTAVKKPVGATKHEPVTAQ
jgi:hypothetical protein